MASRIRPPVRPVCCGTCHAPLVITPDAIGRPRYRCPVCHLVAPASGNTGIDLPLHNQRATCRAELAWPAPAVPSFAESPADRAARRGRETTIEIHAAGAALNESLRAGATALHAFAAAIAPTKERAT